VGRGPQAWRDRLDEELARAGVSERVFVHGFVDDAQLLALYAGADAFVSCSYEEGWGLSLAEALAVGVPCVAYALPSHDDVFGDAVTTAPLGDVAALARALTDVLERPDTAEARRARRAAVAPYSFAAVAARQVAVFSSLLDGSPARGF
jgi:glycosyltransferase involved in cell wall biosynthesis